MNWDDGRLFLAVARAGQMLAAARQLGINQATLSRRMVGLEHSLGTNLLIRRTNGCGLTEDGVQLLAHLERVEAEMMEAQSAMNPQASIVAGTVRVGAPDGFGISFLAPRLAKLGRQHPQLTVQLVPAPQRFSLSKREADIAVMVGRPEQGRLIGQKLTDYTLGLYASPDYLSENRAPSSLADLAGHRLVGHVEDLIQSPSLNYTTNFLVGWQSIVEVSGALGQVEVVASGGGIGVLHDYIALGDSRLVPVLPEHKVKRSYWTVYHESLKGLPRIKAMTEFLSTEVSAMAHYFVHENGQ